MTAIKLLLVILLERKTVLPKDKLCILNALHGLL